MLQIHCPLQKQLERTLNDDYFSEQVLRRLRTMWKDTEFGLPQLFYAATKETAAVLDSTDDEEKIADSIWSRLQIAFRQPSIIILRMTTDSGKTYHVNGFFVREGEIIAMDNKEVAAFCLSEKDSIIYTRKQNEYYETALIDFADE